MAAPTVVTKGAIAALASGNISPTIPAHVADDWLFVLAWKRSATGNLSEGSGTWQTFAPIIRTGASQSQLFSKKAAGAGETITVTQNTAVNIYARAIVVRGADPNGGPNGFGFEAYDGNTSTADPSVFNGVTTLGIDRLILALISGEDDNNASTTVTATDPSAFTESYVESNVGTDACFEFSDAVRATAGATGSVSCNWSTAIPVGATGHIIAVPPPSVDVLMRHRLQSIEQGEVAQTAAGLGGVLVRPERRTKSGLYLPALRAPREIARLYA